MLALYTHFASCFTLPNPYWRPDEGLVRDGFKHRIQQFYNVPELNFIRPTSSSPVPALRYLKSASAGILRNADGDAQACHDAAVATCLLQVTKALRMFKIEILAPPPAHNHCSTYCRCMLILNQSSEYTISKHLFQP